MRLRYTALLLLFMTFAALPAMAADDTQTKTVTPTADGNYVFSPEGCEFQVTFPSEPHRVQRCDTDNPESCHTVTNFTHVFGLDATVDIRVTCNKAEPQMYERYSGDVMKTTLEAMVGKNKLDEYESHFNDTGKVKQAALIGAGTSGNSNKIYMAQLWIGQTSVFSIEGELIGGPFEAADNMFSDILKSATLKQGEQEESTEENKGDDEDQEDEKPAE